MKPTRWPILVAICAGCTLAGMGGLHAAETVVTADAAVVSAFVWRGQVYNDEAVLEPALTVERGGLTINVWGNLDLTDRNDAGGRLTELDVTLGYGREVVAPLYLEAGVAVFTCPHAARLDDETFLGGGTTELYVAAELDLLLQPSLTVSRDIDASDGLYAQLELGHELELSPKATLQLGFSGGWGNADSNLFYFDVDGHALNDGNLTVGLALPLRQNVTVVPALTYTWLWDSAIESGALGLYGEKDLLWGGVTVSITL